MTHTPGPWQVSRFVDKPQYKYADKLQREQWSLDERFIVRGPGLVGSPECNPVAKVVTCNDADVCLIASAPNLLEALKRVRDRLVKGHGAASFASAEFEWLEAAIAKAEGKET